MGFASGTVTFKRFFVAGQLLEGADESLLERLAAHAITRDALQTADRSAYGWTTGDHILDTDFEPAKNVVADGLLFALRIDTNKPPAELVRSYQRQHEQAALKASGRDFLTRTDRLQAREQGVAQADAEARSGAFAKMKQVPVFWDLQRGEVYLGNATSTVVEHFASLFRTTFDRVLTPVTAGELAARWSTQTGLTSGLDGCRPAHFVRPPDGFEASDPSDETEMMEGNRDYLGNEWLTWLWYASQAAAPELASVRGRPVTVLFEKTLHLQCAFRMSGTIAASADNPTRLPESAVALASGKLPVKAGLQMTVGQCAFSLTLRGDAMNYCGVRLPPAEGVVSPRAVLEQRFEQLRDVIDGVDALYAAFLKRRLTPRKWTSTLSAVREWIAAAGKTSRPASELTAVS